MTRRTATLMIGAACAIVSLAGVASAQTTATSTRTQPFEVISVVGNQLVVRGPDGTKELTVPEDFRFTVDGKQLSVHDLKVGMKGEATTTTITTTKKVYVTEERNAKVMQANGNSVILRAQDGTFKLFTQEDANKYKISITRGGKPIEFQQLRANDLVTATMVTSRDEVLTEQQVNARLAQAPAPMAAAAPASKPMNSPAPAMSPAPAAAPASAAAPERKLPKTASQLPLVGVIGFALLAAGAAMTLARRRRA